MDAEQQHRDLEAALRTPARRWATFALLCALAVVYLALFGLYVTRSSDFVASDSNAAAAHAAAQSSLAVPSMLSFVSDSPHVAYLGGGWHLPEPTGTWSRARRAWVFLPVPDQAVELRITGRVPVSAAMPQMHLSVSVQGAPAASVTIEAGQPTVDLLVSVPGPAATGTPIELTFDLDRTVVPQRVGAGADSRSLGFNLQAIEVHGAATTAGAD